MSEFILYVKPLKQDGHEKYSPKRLESLQKA